VKLSALADIAEDSQLSRWDQARLRLTVPIGVIVGIAVIAMMVAILTSARRADEVSLAREQQLLQQAIAERASRVERELESVTATDAATRSIRDNYDPQWVEPRLGQWLETFFDHDLVLVVDGSGHVRYARARSSGDVAIATLPPPLTTIVERARDRRAGATGRPSASPAPADNAGRPARRQTARRRWPLR
jgi:sensor domain CHASE-containing protein